MEKNNIRRILFLSLFLLSVLGNAISQATHFLYLQTDNRQPFYIRYNNKIYSSSSSGYIILGKLSEGPVQFSLGFPQKNEPEQRFELQVEKTDAGFLLKNFNEKGWGLYNLQTSVILYAVAPQSKTSETKGNNTQVITPVVNDPFANMLSQVTQDSTIKNVTIKKEEKIAIDSPKPLKPPVIEPISVKVDSQTTVFSTDKIPPRIETTNPASVKPSDNIQEDEDVWKAPTKTTVQTIRKFESREGLDFVFEVVEANGIKDTIRIFWASDSSQKQTTPVAVIIPQIKQDSIKIKKEDIVEAPVTPEVKKEEPVKIQEPKQEPVLPPKVKNEEGNVPNSNCKANASEEDFLKLRRKMAAQSKEEEMVNEAKKILRNKCFTSVQLKNLAALFLTDEWRYRFYDAALPFVVDYSNFKTLGETIQDAYYKKRFQALLPNN